MQLGGRAALAMQNGHQYLSEYAWHFGEGYSLLTTRAPNVPYGYRGKSSSCEQREHSYAYPQAEPRIIPSLTFGLSVLSIGFG